MDKIVNAKMKRFKGVLDGLRYSVSERPKTDLEIEETLRSENFRLSKTVRHGFPYQPTAMAFDPVQHLLAIGTKSGSLRIFGRPGVDCHIKHEGDVAILQILFLVNEGALVSVCSDDQLHLWTLRQKRPEIVHSLKFQRESITYCHLPFQSKWLYIGTERGNVHIVNIESFMLSGYVINWNKAIELSRKTHPGPVVHLSDCPGDPNKLLIGFESGAIVLWDLKSKTAECRYSCSETLRSISWHHEGKQFMCSHGDGSITTWNVRNPLKPQSLMMPHAKTGKDGKPDPCKPICKLEWKTARAGSGEPFVIFSGGMPYDKASRTPSITVMHSKNTTVLEMEHSVVDFLTLCHTPWNNDFQEPYGIVVLLQNDLVVVDLETQGYPCFENPYPMDIHESPVTACKYYAACPPDLIPAFYSVGSKQKRQGFSDRDWPIDGGAWGTATSYPEIIITGHADGSLKFWDASAVTLQVLYKLKTAKVFERQKSRGGEDEDPFAIQHIYLCNESRLMAVAGENHIVLFKFSKQEASLEVPALEITIQYEIYDDLDSPEPEYPPPPLKPSIGSVSQASGSVGSYSSTASEGKVTIRYTENWKENQTSVKVKAGVRKWAPGYQPDLACLVTWLDGEPPPPITSLSLNSRYGLLAFGNECGLAIVDIIQKSCLLNMGTPDLYGSMDPYQRAPRSPKSKNPQQRPGGIDGLSQTYSSEESKSPTNDQPPDPAIPSPKGSESNSPPILSPQSTKRHSSHGCGLESIKEMSFNFEEDETNVFKAEELMSPTDSEFSVDLAVEATEDVTDAGRAAKEKNLSPAPKSGFVFDTDIADRTQSLPMDAQRPILSSIPVDVSLAEKREDVPDGVKKHPPIRRTLSDQHQRTLNLEEIEHKINDSESQGKLWAKGRRFSLFNKKGRNKEKEKEKEKEIQKPPRGVSPELNKQQKLSETEALHRAYHSENDLLDIGKNKDESVNNNDKTLLDVNMEARTHVTEEKPKEKSFVRKMSRKIRTSLHIDKKSVPYDEGDDARDEHSHNHKHEKRKKSAVEKFEVIDLTSDDVKTQPTTRRVTYASHAAFDKNDGSFSRSRSSSMSSLENISKEAIQCLVFADAYTRKTDAFTCPCLWVGTSLGSVLVIVLNLPPEGDQRKTQPVIVSPSGTIFRLKGTILGMSFLDCNGVLIPAITDAWKDVGQEEQQTPTKKSAIRQPSVCSPRPRMSPTSSTEVSDRQFAIICSEKQARVMSLPSQTCAYKVKVTETSVVVCADIISVKESVCLACYVANGHILTFSLPSLKLLLDIDFLPLTELRIAKTFGFSNYGHALYFCSPTEVQKLTLSFDMCDNLNEMLGELFLARETPEAPKQSFFKNLFSGGSSTVDREELFGETSGKAARGVVKYSPGTAGMASVQERSALATSEIGRAKLAAIERGERLSEMEQKTEQMTKEAENFALTAHHLLQKCKDKKWYQF